MGHLDVVLLAAGSLIGECLDAAPEVPHFSSASDHAAVLGAGLQRVPGAWGFDPAVRLLGGAPLLIWVRINKPPRPPALLGARGNVCKVAPASHTCVSRLVALPHEGEYGLVSHSCFPFPVSFTCGLRVC